MEEKLNSAEGEIEKSVYYGLNSSLNQQIKFGFKKIKAPLDEMARARLCQSSGSEYSSESTPELEDLADLVDSFLETECRDGGAEGKREEKTSGPSDESWIDDATVHMLKSLVGGWDDNKDSFTRMLRTETELACLDTVTGSENFKRELMGRLRERGFDAGLCKSRWKKSGRCPAGNYEYIDVISDTGDRFIVEVDLKDSFDIVRATSSYNELLEYFHGVFIGKIEDLKTVIRIMCNSACESLKSRELPIPPWRKKDYMHRRWFSSYKRTIQPTPENNISESSKIAAGKRAVGFSEVPFGNVCRGNMKVIRENFKCGNLAALLKGI